MGGIRKDAGIFVDGPSRIKVQHARIADHQLRQPHQRHHRQGRQEGMLERKARIRFETAGQPFQCAQRCQKSRPHSRQEHGAFHHLPRISPQGSDGSSDIAAFAPGQHARHAHPARQKRQPRHYGAERMLAPARLPLEQQPVVQPRKRAPEQRKHNRMALRRKMNDVDPLVEVADRSVHIQAVDFCGAEIHKQRHGAQKRQQRNPRQAHPSLSLCHKPFLLPCPARRGAMPSARSPHAEERAPFLHQPFTCLAKLSLRPTTRLNTGRASVESGSLQK